MPRTSETFEYHLLAEHYDQLFGDMASWGVSAREHILARILPRTQSACDLACGTGTAALELARRGIRMYAVDLSPGMCRIAREKAKAARLPLQVIRADMRSFQLPAPVDLILCEYDAINHVPHPADLDSVCRSAAQALNPGGYFYFDVNNHAAFQNVWSMTWCIEKPGVVLVMRGSYDPILTRAAVDVDWFLRTGKLWRRRTERVQEVCWPRATIVKALRDAGFASIRTWDAQPFFAGNAIIRRGYRTFFLARKAA